MLTLDDVVWGFRYILGRDPTPSEVTYHRRENFNRLQLRKFLLESEEFAISEKVVGHTSKWIITEIFGGDILIWIDLADKFVSFGCLIDNYEPLETLVFRRLLKSGFHVIDTGANIGWFTFLASMCVGQSGHVTAIEPRIPTVDYLRRSICLNRLEKNITVLQNAAGDRADAVSLIWRPASRNPGSTHIGYSDLDTQVQMADMQQLDILLQGIKVDCIKMDIEGAEGLAFAGAANTIRESRPFILCEINPFLLSTVSAMSVDEFLDLVRGYGYVPFMIGELAELSRLVGTPDFSGREVINIVLAHVERTLEL